MATAQVVNPTQEHHLTRKPLQPLAATQTPTDLLTLALQHDAGIDVIERLAALQEKALAREAEIAFNDALSRIQAEVKRVAPDLLNPQTSSRYASYAAIDRVIRPIYTAEGMSLSFSDADCPKPDHIRIVCYASLGAYTRTYQKDMAADGKGAKGGDVMTKTHAEAAADSYAKRYLVKNIFNIAIGEDDDDGNCKAATPRIPTQRVEEMIAKIRAAQNGDDLFRAFKAAYVEGHEKQDTAALDAYIKAKDARRKELANGNR